MQRRFEVKVLGTLVVLAALSVLTPLTASATGAGHSTSAANGSVAAPESGASLHAAWQKELAEATRRCDGMELVLRDTVSGEALNLGTTDHPGPGIPLPEEEPGTAQQIECADGYLVALEIPPLARVKGSAARLAQQAARIATEQEAAVRRIATLAPAAQIVRTFRVAFNGMHIRVRPVDADALRRAGMDVRVNGEMRATLDVSVPLVNADDVWTASPSATGRGVEIAVLDTGVDYRHADLGGGCYALPTCKVVGGYDVINQDPDPMDDHGHGTHVAATAAGNGELDGVAPDAKILAYKVLSASGSGTTAQVIEGVERAIDPNRDGDTADRADVVTMSLGGTGDPDDPLSRAVDAAVAAGSVVTVAAGNSGSAERTIGSPGTARGAITVGASTKTDDIASFSSRGPVVWGEQSLLKPDLVAPGVSICAARYGSYGSSPCRSGKHVSLSGTSMATPHVAGAAALLLEAAPGLTPDQVKSTMKGTAVLGGTKGSAASWGAGRLDILAAMRQGTTPPVARLDPVALTGGVRAITGTAWASSWGEWKLELASYRGVSLPEQSWTVLARWTTAPTDAVLHQLQTNALVDGKYVVRLTVTDAAGNRAVDHGYLEVDKFNIGYPLDRDVLRGGDVVEVLVEVDPSVEQPRFALHYRQNGADAQWIPISAGSTSSLRWNTAALAAGPYSVRVTLEHEGGTASESVRVTLDPTLHSQPIRVRHDLHMDCYPCPNWAGWVDPIVEDLDGDGRSELLYMWHAGIPELRAVSPEGGRLWTASIGSTTPPPEVNLAFDLLHQPVVADTDGDGEKEIYLFNIYDSRMYVLSGQGEVTRSFPVSIDQGQIIYLPRLSMSDVDADGRPDLILSLQAFSEGYGDRAKVVIVTTSGRELADWFVSTQSPRFVRFYGPGYNYMPAALNIDDDNDLEIVAVDHIGERIRAFEWNGIEISEPSQEQDPLCTAAGSLDGAPRCQETPTDPPGWPVVADQGSLEHFPVIAGDLDDDGDLEIVAGTVWGKTSYLQLLVLDLKGNPMPGWPLDLQTDTNAGPSIGDIDGDDDLELVLPGGLRTYAYHDDGTTVAGWPTVMRGVSYRQALIADVTGDGSVDVVVHSSSGIEGRLEAWSATGAPIPGFPKPLERDDHSPVVVAALEEGGRVSIVATSSSDYEQATGRSKARSSIHVWELGAPFDPSTAPWPMFQHDLSRTGRV